MVSLYAAILTPVDRLVRDIAAPFLSRGQQT